MLSVVYSGLASRGGETVHQLRKQAGQGFAARRLRGLTDPKSSSFRCEAS